VEALRVKPNDWMTQLNLGNGLAELGRFVEAEEAHRKAAELNPRCAECWLRLGQDLETQGLTEAAKAAYRRALEIDPQLARPATQPAAASTKAGQ
jgi:Flp pilus assembly protein TadD